MILRALPVGTIWDLGLTPNGSAAWRNRLTWGDKKYALPSLLAESTGKVNLIYIDPLGFAFEAPIQLTLRGHN